MDLAVKAFLDWLAKYIPPMMAAFGVGYKLGKEGEYEAKKELAKKELELELEKNANKVLNDIYDKSDADVLADALREGESIRNSKR